MVARWFVLLLTRLTIALAAATMLSACASEATSDARSAEGGPPRLANGRPDLQGVWSYATLTPLERPTELGGKATLSEEEVAEFEAKTLETQNRDRRDGAEGDDRGSDGRTDLERAYNQFWWDYGTKVVGTRRTSLVTDPPDGRIPALLPEGKARLAALEAKRTTTPRGPEDRTLGERCIHISMAGPPMMPGPYNNNMQLLQTSTHVAIHNEMIHDTRIIPLDGRAHLDANIRQILGDSRARWDGDTLVVETTNFTNRTGFRGSTDTLRLIERFTRVAPDTLLYEFTAEDPQTWARPWSAAIPMTKSDQRIYEYACHEGNYGMAGILAGARAEAQSK